MPERLAASLRPVPRLAPAVVEGRLAEWRRLLRQSVTQGRAVLQRVLQGRITFTPRPGGGLDFTAATRFDRLFAGVVVPMPAWLAAKADNREGTEHIGPDDTPDSDYGKLLEQAQGRKPKTKVGVATLVGFEPTISTLKGWRAGPLHHRVSVESVYAHQLRRRVSHGGRTEAKKRTGTGSARLAGG